MKQLINLVHTCVWISGVVLAKGFWSAMIAICIPPWAWYLVGERIWSLL